MLEPHGLTIGSTREVVRIPFEWLGIVKMLANTQSVRGALVSSVMLLFTSTSIAESPQAWARGAAPKPLAESLLPESGRYGGPAASKATHAERLTALELALSTVVAQSPNLWRLEALESEAAELLHDTPAGAERVAVEQLADRIDRFASIASRYQTAPAELPLVPRRSKRVEQPPATTPEPLAEAKPRTTYDATGVLRPVVSKRPGAPKFALVDDQGKVTTFVSAAEGVDLKPMLGKRLGVRGNRGFIPEYQREHVTAERVAALDRVVR